MAKKPQVNPKKKTLQRSKVVSVREHIQELRSRLLIILCVMFVGAIITFLTRERIFDFLFNQSLVELYFLTPTAGIDLTIKLSLLFGFILSLPVVIYQLLKFLEPVLTIKTVHLSIVLVVSLMLASMGLVFSYVVVLPVSFKFLLKIGESFMEPVITAESYLSFFLTTSFISVLVFELPLVLFICRLFFGFTSKQILSYQRYVIVLSSLLIAIITPTTDIFNMLVMLGPLWGLFYSSVVVIYLLEKFKIVH